VIRNPRHAMVLAALISFLPVAAQAADQRFCQDYARAALNQVRAALSNPRCVGGVQGNRWSSDFRVHYDWCLSQPYAAVGGERDARTAMLRACR
jgi:hypothetical protein